MERGSCDGLYINTRASGWFARALHLTARNARPGDVILLSGTLGDHGIAIMAEREGLEFECPVESDSAALHTLVETMLASLERASAACATRPAEACQARSTK